MEMANPFRLFKKPVKVYFVGSKGYPSIMGAAYRECKGTGIQPKWMTSLECMNREPEKTDIFVLKDFEGFLFKKLQTAQCSIFGPIYVLHCLHTNKLIPPDTSPILNTSMQDVIAHLSGYTDKDKLFYRRRIEQMSGNICTKPLCNCITHLIFESPQLITPAEYENAGARGIEVFTTDWINLIWDSRNQSDTNTVPLPDPFPLPSPIPAFHPPAINNKLPDGLKVFQGLTFIVETSNDVADLFTKDDIIYLNGKILPENSRGIPDFAVVPFNSNKSNEIAKEIVTIAYIDDCVRERARVAIQYYHRPIYVPEGLKPLKNCVIVIAEYSKKERNYFSKLLKELGARGTETFDNKVTHCICKSSQGDHYLAAVKWGRPAVTGEWLRACVDELRYVDEEPFLVGVIKARERVDIGKQGFLNRLLQRENIKWESYPQADEMKVEHAGRTGGARRSKSMGKFKFMLSEFKDKDRKDQEKLIRKLGGEVASDYDESVTHMVCIRPSKSTSVKIMACIAGGKWILHWSYLRDSEEFGGFVDEEGYEWGNPVNKGLMERLKDENDRKIAEAAYKWRLRRESEGEGVFSGITAMLIVEEGSYDGFERLIRAGGGSLVNNILDYRAPFIEQMSYCFIDHESRKKVDYFNMACRGIWCFPLGFLYTLITDGPVNKKDNILPEFEKHLSLCHCVNDLSQ